ncbi:MAG TPA: LysR family transcriptional regulator [Tetragenococcus sp.]|nr:LysR family transcriptional regulator [Tetragenococcus sp.]
MDERDFEILIAIDRSKNITLAAESLFITQSALSKRISAIEDELGAQILIRSRKGVYFTTEGEEILRNIEIVSDTLQQMRNHLISARGIIAGKLNAGISFNYTLYQLPHLLANYHQKFPEVTMHISTENSIKLYEQLLNGAIDVAIIRGDFPWNGKKILLNKEKICAIKSRKNRNKKMQELQYIGRKTDLPFEREVIRWLQENSIDSSKQRVYVDNLTACVELVKVTDSWTIVPEICLNDFDGEVFPLKFANGKPFVRSTYLMYSDIVEQLPQVREFIHLIRQSHKKEEL